MAEKRCLHQFGLYYGVGHFMTRSLPFVLDGLRESARILVAVEPVIETLLRRGAAEAGLPTPAGHFTEIPIVQLVQHFFEGGTRALRADLEALLADARAHGCEKIRYLGQATYEIAQTRVTGADFLRWEAGYHQASEGLPIDTLCMYDAAALSASQEEVARHHHNFLRGAT